MSGSTTNTPSNFHRPTQLAEDALRRFPKTGYRELARYLATRHDKIYTSIEHAYDAIRRARGMRKDYWKKYWRTVRRGAFATRALQRVDYKLTPGGWGILSDPHIPFHEPKPIETLLAWFKDKKVDGILLNGDIHDCEALTPWPQTRRPDFIDEVEQVIDFLDVLRKEFPKVKIVWKPGNHEERLPRYYRKEAPLLADLPSASMGEILSLEARKIEYLDFKQRVRAHDLSILHGHEMRGQYSVISPSRWALLKAKSNVLTSHFHQTSDTTETTLEDKLISAWSLGCACNLHPDYNPWGNRWNWGGAIIYLDNKSWEVDSRKVLPSGKLV